MAVIMDKVTLKIINRSGNTPEFPRDRYIINPDEEMMVSVPREYWKVDGDILREMTQIEKDEYEYNTNSKIYFINTKTLESGKDGREYESDSNAIINPDEIAGGIEYGKVVADKLVAMTATERTAYDYTNKSSIYLIIEKELLTNQNGADFESDINAIINPTMPEGIGGAIDVETRFTKVVNGEIVMMSEIEIDTINSDEAATKAIEDAAIETARILKEWEINIAAEIAKVYTLADEISMIRKLSTGESIVTDDDIVEWFAVIAAAKIKYIKP